MTEPNLDLAGPLRDAIMGCEPITVDLGAHMGEPAIFTRRPVPAMAAELASYPLILINPESAVGDEDGLTSDRPFVIRDIAVYGQQPTHYRKVEAIGYRLRALFHRQKFALVPDGYSVIDIRVSGPIAAPVDDAATVGRMVSLTIRLRRRS